MKYKLEVISAMEKTKEFYFETLEEVLDEKRSQKKAHEEELKEKETQHKKVYDCDGSCSSFLHTKARSQIKFKVSIARWEVIG